MVTAHEVVHACISRDVTPYGPLAFTRAGSGAAVSAITDGATAHGFAYSRQGQMTRRSLSVAGTPRYAVDLTYDDSGLIATRTETVGGVTSNFEYTHDALGRLVRVRRNGAQVEAYGYDSPPCSAWSRTST